MHSALRSFLAALAAAAAACTSTPETVVEKEELERIDSGVAIVGAPDGFETSVAVSVSDLLRQYSETGRRTFIDDAAYEIELFLQSNGFATARTTYEVIGDKRARIDIRAGKQSVIGKVTAKRNDECPLSESDLVRYVNGPRTGLFGTGQMLFVTERVNRAPARIVEDLVALGYLDATAHTDPREIVPKEKGGPVRVKLVVDSGRRYHVEDVTFALERTAASIDDELHDAAITAIERVEEADREEDGRVAYEPRIASRLRSALADEFGGGGYPDATIHVEAAVDRVKRTVVLHAVATPGPYVVLEHVTLESEGRTREAYMRSRLELGRGDRYDSHKVRESVRKLYRTGLFSQVTPKLVGSGDTRDLVFEIVEQSSIEIAIEPGWGSYELARAKISARDRNLFGTGLAASTSATLAVRAQRATITLSDPWFLYRELVGDIELQYDRREEPSFTRESRGLGAFITKQWSRYNSSTAGYRFRRSEAKDIETVDEDVREAQGAVNVSGVILTQRFDRRDALFAPTRGYYTEASSEVALAELGSQIEFIRGRLSAALFYSLSSDDVLGFGTRWGLIAPAFDDVTIPLQERFFAGGENSVRSFMESELGPRDENGEPNGGEAYGTLSVEWRHELGNAFQSAVFVDAGFVEDQAGDVFDFDDVRTGVGVGLRYLLPIGPLRVDGAVNPDPRSGEDDWVVHFGIGMPF